jgi:hypothetical protein
MFPAILKLAAVGMVAPGMIGGGAAASAAPVPQPILRPSPQTRPGPRERRDSRKPSGSRQYARPCRRLRAAGIQRTMPA